MATYFISDLHLQASQAKVAQGFLDFVASLEDAEALYILGDFFEFWIGDDYSDPFVETIKTALKTASTQYPVYFMHGNRDFMIGQAFADETGMSLLEDPSIVTVEGRQVLLMHGDSLCTRDEVYMRMRPLLRNPAWQASMLEKSIEERLVIAQNARMESATKDPKMANSEIMDVTPDAVVKAMDDAGVDLLIHGHTHRPKVHTHQLELKEGSRMVLGDWHEDKGWMIKACNGKFELLSLAL